MIEKSASTIGRMQAHRSLPAEPSDCRVKEPHVRVTVGADPWALLAGEGNQLNKQNARTDRCSGTGGFYDRVKATQEAATK